MDSKDVKEGLDTAADVLAIAAVLVSTAVKLVGAKKAAELLSAEEIKDAKKLAELALELKFPSKL